jgi:hypothetical protein
MRVPSRFMPKYALEPISLARKILWLTISVVVLLPFAYFAVIHPLITTAAMAGVFYYSHLEVKKFKAHRAYLASTRAQGNICNFARSFDCREIDTWIIRAVFEELKMELGEFETFSLKTTDRFTEDLHIDHEDLDLIYVPAIAARTGRSLKICRSNPYLGKVTSVGDLVRFFNSQPLESDKLLRRKI